MENTPFNSPPPRPSGEGSRDKDLQAHIEQLYNMLQRPKEKLLEILPANAWLTLAAKRPVPKMLFSEFWFEQEFCMLFADTNLGKSILAVQLADSISRGVAIAGFCLEAEAQKVLYVDFELSDKQFEGRYSLQFQEHYTFSEHLLRAELTSVSVGQEESGHFEAQLHKALAGAVLETQARVLIIDNITYLSSETERARHALPLMKQLKALQKEHGLSILTLAHTPKRDMTRPLTRNDLQGSKMLINFCDSAFAIGESQQDSRVRYLKQIKARSTEIKYDSERVCVCEVSKPKNFLQFVFLSQGAEFEHLRQLTDSDKEKRVAEVLDMKASGVSNVAIAQNFGVTEGTVRHWLRNKQSTTETGA